MAISCTGEMCETRINSEINMSIERKKAETTDGYFMRLFISLYYALSFIWLLLLNASTKDNKTKKKHQN